MHTWCNNTCAFSDAFTNEIKHTKQTKKKMRDIVYFVQEHGQEKNFMQQRNNFFRVYYCASTIHLYSAKVLLLYLPLLLIS